MNRDIYKDEFGVYHEVEDEKEETLDGLEDDEQDHYEDDADDSDYDDEEELEEEYDEDQEYLNERRPSYDVDED